MSQRINLARVGLRGQGEPLGLAIMRNGTSTFTFEPVGGSEVTVL